MYVYMYIYICIGYIYIYIYGVSHSAKNIGLWNALIIFPLQWRISRPRLQASGRGAGPGGGVPGIAQHDVELLLDLRRAGAAEEGLGEMTVVFVGWNGDE